MSRYVLSPQAKHDLDDIEQTIAQDNPARAVGFVEEIIERLKLLADHPQLGRARPELSVPNVRSFPFRRYVIFYRPASYGIDVLRIPHGRRNWTSIFGVNS